MFKLELQSTRQQRQLAYCSSVKRYGNGRSLVKQVTIPEKSKSGGVSPSSEEALERVGRRSPEVLGMQHPGLGLTLQDAAGRLRSQRSV